MSQEEQAKLESLVREKYNHGKGTTHQRRGQEEDPPFVSDVTRVYWRTIVTDHDHVYLSIYRYRDRYVIAWNQNVQSMRHRFCVRQESLSWPRASRSCDTTTTNLNACRRISSYAKQRMRFHVSCRLNVFFACDNREWARISTLEWETFFFRCPSNGTVHEHRREHLTSFFTLYNIMMRKMRV